MSDERHVLVTTDKDRRGVFGGLLVSHDDGVVVLRDCRMAVYWSTAMHGVLGLAVHGPDEQSRISPAVPGETQLDGVTLIAEMTPEAVERWEAEPWGS